jgi:hypothetical protein
MKRSDIRISKSGPNLGGFNSLIRSALCATTACTFSMRTCGTFSIWFLNKLRATTLCTFRHLISKIVQHWSVLCILTWKCSSRYSGVYFIDILISKRGPRMVCFVHFDLGMCFAPQRVQFFISHLPRCLRTAALANPFRFAFYLSVLSTLTSLEFPKLASFLAY